MLQRIIEMPEHDFWPADISLAQALLATPKIIGHRQITDAYLLGLCRAYQARLATLDRGVLSLAQQELKSVVLIQ